LRPSSGTGSVVCDGSAGAVQGRGPNSGPEGVRPDGCGRELRDRGAVDRDRRFRGALLPSGQEAAEGATDLSRGGRRAHSPIGPCIQGVGGQGLPQLPAQRQQAERQHPGGHRGDEGQLRPRGPGEEEGSPGAYLGEPHRPHTRGEGPQSHNRGHAGQVHAGLRLRCHHRVLRQRRRKAGGHAHLGPGEHSRGGCPGGSWRQARSPPRGLLPEGQQDDGVGP